MKLLKNCIYAAILAVGTGAFVGICMSDAPREQKIENIRALTDFIRVVIPRSKR